MYSCASRAFCPMCSRTPRTSCIRTLLFHVPCVLRALTPHVPRALRTLVFYVLLALRTLMPHMPHALVPSCLMPQVPCALRASHALCLKYLVPYVLSCLTCVTCSCTSRVLYLVYSRTARTSSLT